MCALTIADGEVLLHPPGDRARRRAVSSEALLVAKRQARGVGVAHPLREEPLTIRRPELLRVVES